MRPPVGMREVLRAAAARLEESGVHSARVDAELLAAHTLGIERSRLLFTQTFPAESLGAYWELVDERARRVPLQHLTGETGFRYLTLSVRPGVFIPRPETEVVAQVAIDAALKAAPPARIVDLCTGAGGIAISCAKEVPGAEVWAVDVNPMAVALTRDNAAAHGLVVEVSEGDVEVPALLAQLGGTIDVVVSNPPYIPFQAEPIDEEVRTYDPPAALYGGGEDGLRIPAAVIARARDLLKEGGLLVVEHGDDQGPAMRELVERSGGFVKIRTDIDLNGRDRMVLATRSKVAD